MKGENFEELKSRYGEPLYIKVVDRSKLSKIEIMNGNIPNGVAVFKIDHPSKIIIVAKYSEWHCNNGERSVVNELLSENSKLHDTVNKLKEALSPFANRYTEDYRAVDRGDIMFNTDFYDAHEVMKGIENA